MSSFQDGSITESYMSIDNGMKPYYIITKIMDPYYDLIPKYELIYPKIEDLLKKNEELKVYKVTLIDGRQLVLKHTRFDSGHKLKLYNLIKEYYMLRTLSFLSPNVTKGLDIQEIHEGNEVIIEILMEYGGDDLEHLELIEGDSVKIGYQLLDILSIMESIGFSHIDIKPRNIVWDFKIVKLIDFATSISFFGNPEKLMQPLCE